MRGHLDIVDYLLSKTPKQKLIELQDALSLNGGAERKKLALDEEKKIQRQIRQTNQARLWEELVSVDEQRNNEGISGVFFAIRTGNLNCLRLLRKYGANFNLECMSESK